MHAAGLDLHIEFSEIIVPKGTTSIKDPIANSKITPRRVISGLFVAVLKSEGKLSIDDCHL